MAQQEKTRHQHGHARPPKGSSPQEGVMFERDWKSRWTERTHEWCWHVAVKQTKRTQTTGWRGNRCPWDCRHWIWRRRRNWRANHRSTIQEPGRVCGPPCIKGCHDVWRRRLLLNTRWQKFATFPTRLQCEPRTWPLSMTNSEREIGRSQRRGYSGETQVPCI